MLTQLPNQLYCKSVRGEKGENYDFNKGNINMEIWVDKILFEKIDHIEATQEEKNYTVMANGWFIGTDEGE